MAKTIIQQARDLVANLRTKTLNSQLGQNLRTAWQTPVQVPTPLSNLSKNYSAFQQRNLASLQNPVAPALQPLTPLVKSANAFVENRYVKPIMGIPSAAKETFRTDRPLLTKERGFAALNLAGGVGSLFPDVIGDVAMPVYDYLKGARASSIRGGNIKQNIMAGIQSASLEKPVGLGEAVTSKEGIGQTALNMAELPLLLYGGMKATKSKAFRTAVLKNYKEIDSAIQMGRRLDTLGQDPTLYINITGGIKKVADQFIPKVVNSREMKELSRTNPNLYYKYLTEYLSSTLDDVLNPINKIKKSIPGAEQGFGSIIKSVRDENPLESLKQEARKYKSAVEKENQFLEVNRGKTIDGITIPKDYKPYRRTITGDTVDINRLKTDTNYFREAYESTFARGYGTDEILYKKMTKALVPEGKEASGTLSDLYNRATKGVETTKDIVPQTPQAPNISKGKVSLIQPTKESLPVPSTDILPQKGKLNVQNLNLTDESKGIVRASDTTPATVIGNKDVIETAKLTEGTKRPMTDTEQQVLLAKRLNSRQSVVTLTKEFDLLKQSGADEKTLIAKFNEIADQSRIAQQEGTLAGRQLQAQKILADELASPQQKILALLDNAGVDKSKYVKDAINVNWNNPKEVVNFYRKYVPPKLGEVLTEFRYTNMLSSPLTHITNIATNMFQAGVVAPVEKTVLGGLDWVKSKTTGAERQYYASDGIKYAKGFYQSLPEAWTKFKNVLSGKEISIKPDMERIPISTGKKYQIYTTPLRALEAADQMFMTLVKGGEKATGLTETAAENAAKYRLFRQAFDPEGKTGQGYLLKTWDKYNSYVNQLRRLPGGNWIVPFLQAPTNILKQGVEYSPLGLGTLPGSKNKLEQLSKTIVGSTVFAGAYGLLNSINFTLEVPKGTKEREYFYAAGMQPYSVKIGNKWVSYSKLGSLSYPIAMAAALRYAEKYNLPSEKESAISTAIGSFFKFFSDQSYVKQLGDFIDSVQTGKGIVGGLKAEASNTVSQLIPYKSLLSWLSRMIDPYSRKSEGIVGGITSQLPGLSMLSEPYYNPVTKQPSERPNRFLNSFFPIKVTTGEKGIENMYKYLGSAKRAYSNLKQLPQQEAASMFEKIRQYDPSFAKKIIEVSKEVQIGVTNKDKQLINTSVSDGERAYKLANEFNRLKTKEEKAKLWQEYVSKGIITKEVATQLIKLLK